MAFTYIIYTSRIDKFNIGAIQEAISNRLIKHNLAYYRNKNFTAIANDWEFVLIFGCQKKQTKRAAKGYNVQEDQFSYIYTKYQIAIQNLKIQS